MIKSAILLIFLAAFVTASGFAQAPPSVDAKKAEMKKLEKLAGHWKGSGWLQRGPTKETFTGTETVQSKLDGLAMLVEGRFVDPQGKVVHETLAVLSAKNDLGGYNFATYLANGITGVQELKVVGDHFEWGFAIPNAGTVRYTITVDDKTWFEIGEFSRDGGKTWMKNFEMKLERVK